VKPWIPAAVLVLLCVGCPARGVAGQYSNRRIAAVKVTTPPVIDGKIDDACWKTLPQATEFTDTILGSPVADQTIVWLGYDDRNVYIAFHCKDSNPRGIVAKETRRGTSLSCDDCVYITLNTFNTSRSEDESTLCVNALGTQNASLAGGHATKHEWEGVWQSAARIVDDGWVAEMTVPWRIFTRPDTQNGKTTLGLNFTRYQPRTQVASSWSYLGPQSRSELGGTWNGLELPPPANANPLSVLGYALGGYQHHAGSMRLGADARYQITPQLTALATANPDFSNVEGAVTSIDFSYAEKLPSERRPFFLEGADFFTESGTGFKPFASQRIGQFDGGGKFFGRVAPGTDLGVLATSDFGARTDTVIRVKHEFSALDSVDAEIINRAETGLNNTVSLVSGATRRGDWWLSGIASHSTDTAGSGDRVGYGIGWSTKYWSASIGERWVSPLFAARDGYVAFVDDINRNASLSYWADWRSGPFTGFGVWTDAYDDKHYDGSFFQRGVEGGIDAITRTHLYLSVWSTTSRYQDNRDHALGVYISYPRGNKFCNYGASYTWGRQGGYDYYDLSPFINWRFFDRLVATASSEIVHLDGTSTQEVFSLSYDLSRKQAVSARLIERSGRVTWYASFRQSGYAGAEYFVILGDPNAPRFTERLMVKAVVPL
jgi:hypothetical protein